LNGIKPIKAMAREGSLFPLLREEVNGIHDAQRLKIFAHYTMLSFQEPVTVLVLAVGMYVFIVSMKVPFSALLILAFLFSRIVNQINPFLRHLQAVVLCESAFWSLRDSIDLAEASRETEQGTRRPEALRESISFRDVSFAYGDAEVLRDVSFELPAGRFTAITGLSGAGKTTIADLMIGLQTPQAGSILVDGTDLADVNLRAWRSRVGYVPQEMFLFHDTVLHNVTLGDESVSREAATEALQSAEAWDFVSDLPEGMDAVVGERGSKMSGGQRQRIAIARALAGRPSLLILDEVTTALDPATEESICATLKKLRGLVTIVSISHQPALKEMADVIYELRRGKIFRIDGGQGPTAPEGASGH
jgi:ATP-binding cassette subfamily C protein